MEKHLHECGCCMSASSATPARGLYSIDRGGVGGPSGFHKAKGVPTGNGKLPIACASVVGRYFWILESGPGIMLVFGRRALDKFPIRPGCLALRHAYNRSLRQRAAS